MQERDFWFVGALAGLASMLCYLAAILISWPETQLGTTVGVLVASAFPILGIIFYHTLHSVIAAEAQGAANRLGLLFMALAFATLLAMLLVQQAVMAGLPRITGDLPVETARALRRGLRLVDMGLDVAWDFLGATGIVFFGFAMRRHSALRRFWAPVSVVLGGALILLNAATFPWPPASDGLFDIGPLVGLFLLALTIRVAVFARHAPVEPRIDTAGTAIS